MTVTQASFDLGSSLGGEPKHERLTRHLTARLADGSLKPGEALPTEIQLAEQLAISRTTVRQAFAELERRGVIRRIRGRGTFISEAATAAHEPMADRKEQTSSLYGLVLPELEHGFYPALQRSFSDAAGRQHKQVIVCNSDQDTLRQADILLQLADRKVDGIAMVPTSHPDRPTPPHQIRPLKAMGIPIVLCHRSIDGIRAPLVAFSGLDVGRIAGRALLDHGHRRVAYFGTHRGPMSEFYLRGLREKIEAAGSDLPDEWIYFGSRLGHAVAPQHEASIRQKLEALFASPEPPTAIFTSFDSEAELIFLLLTQMGVRVPLDVSLVGVGGASRVGAFAQRLASVVVDEDDLGRQAFAVLDEMQRGIRPLDDAESHIVAVSLSDGMTLAPAGGARA